VTESISPEQLESVTRPHLEAWTMPPRVYWSQEILDLEFDRVFAKEWICVGRVEDIPNPGDFFTRTIVTEPLIVVRDGEGEIRAHVNVCRHRGCEIVEGSGQVKAFRCPYHGWMYGLNGELRATPDFQETKNFDKRDYGLHQAKVEVWNNLIFVNLDPDATPLASRITEIDDWGLDKYDLESFVTVSRFEIPAKCNWKIYIENGAEEYHIPWIHPGLQDAAPMKGWMAFKDLTEEPWMLIVAQYPGVSWGPNGEMVFDPQPGVADLAPEYDGLPILMIFPNLTLLLTADTLVWRTMMPVSPEETSLWFGVCIPRANAERYFAGDAETREKVDFVVRELRDVTAEDVGISERQQRGIRSRLATQGRFGKHESLAWLFDKRLAEKAYLASAG
jgi:phenylpropionate dioxygenase-like ring-hydroxylating dioxygenase large terminal subunit